MEVKLREIIEGAPVLTISQLRIVLESYHQLGEFDRFDLLLEKTVCDILESICSKIICKHLKYAENYQSKNNINYKTLCRKLKVDTFMECFMDICGRVFDILHCYYKIESMVIQFRNKNKCMYVCFYFDHHVFGNI